MSPLAQPCLSNFSPVFLDFISQPNVNYSIDVITIKFYMHAKGQTEPCDLVVWRVPV